MYIQWKDVKSKVLNLTIMDVYLIERRQKHEFYHSPPPWGKKDLFYWQKSEDQDQKVISSWTP